MLVILLIGFFLRLDKLATLPPGVSFDESTSVVDAALIRNTGNYPLYEDFGRPEPLYQILLAFNTFLFGPTVFAARLFSVFVGTLTIAAAYWAACECLYDLPLFQRRLGGLAAAAV